MSAKKFSRIKPKPASEESDDDYAEPVVVKRVSSGTGLSSKKKGQVKKAKAKAESEYESEQEDEESESEDEESEEEIKPKRGKGSKKNETSAKKAKAKKSGLEVEDGQAEEKEFYVSSWRFSNGFSRQLHIVFLMDFLSMCRIYFEKGLETLAANWILCIVWKIYNLSIIVPTSLAKASNEMWRLCWGSTDLKVFLMVHYHYSTFCKTPDSTKPWLDSSKITSPTIQRFAATSSSMDTQTSC